jgi:hypothetical protein
MEIIAANKIEEESKDIVALIVSTVPTYERYVYAPIVNQYNLPNTKYAKSQLTASYN